MSIGGGGSRVSIPADVRPIIAEIKNFAALSHTDDEIYAVLKECAMDPNDTAQKLLLQDTFHEVRRKREKKKENSKEYTDLKSRPWGQGRGGRGGRGSSYSRHVSSDFAGGRIIRNKENGLKLSPDVLLENSSSRSSPVAEDKVSKSKGSLPSSVHLANGTSTMDEPRSSHGPLPLVSCDSNMDYDKENFAADSGKTRAVKSISSDSRSHPTIGKSASGSKHTLSSKTLSSVHSTSDPALMPSLDSHNLGEVGTIKHVVRSQQSTLESTTSMSLSSNVPGSELSSANGKGSTNTGSSHVHGKMHTKSRADESNQSSDMSQAVSSSLSTGSAGSRPSSNYSNRSQQLSSQRVVPNKEWKPKSTSVNPGQPCEIIGTCDVPVGLEVQSTQSVVSEESVSKLENKLDELQLTVKQHVIIPNHLQVPDSEKRGLSFGSFDANFKLSIGLANGSASEESVSPVYEQSQDTDENVEKPSEGHHGLLSSVQDSEFSDKIETVAQAPESSPSKEVSISEVSASQDENETKQEHVLVPEGPQISVVQTAPYSGFGLVPQMLGGQFAPFESSESQTYDGARAPSFVVQQPFDLTSYYAQLYRPAVDTDGRLSPFLSSGGYTKHNGNIAGTPSQNGQNQENGNSIVLSTSGTTPPADQAAVIQSSVTVPQQTHPVFRQPAGVHISHYPPNYIPYNQYFPPFFVAPPAMHHYMSTAAFPQQLPTGTMYPAPGAVAAAAAGPVKYNLSQFKPGANTGNSTIVGLPAGYGTYNPSQSVNNGNSTGNEDLNSSQFKENNAYIPGQQSEGSAVWIPAPGRDVSNLQAGSFYSMPAQGQHLTFAPSQAGHGSFSGIFHPAATMAAAAGHPLLQQSQTVAGALEVIGPPAGVYQQSQRAQVSWPNNY